MIITKKAKRLIVLYLAAFLICGITHIMFYGGGVDFFKSGSQFICGILLVLWGVTIQRRITDKRLRTLIFCMEIFLLTHLILQIIRYNFFEENITIVRYIWYAYFIPGIVCTIFFFAIALSINRDKEQKLPPIFMMAIVAGAVILLGVMTNDLHFQAYSFSGGVLDDRGNEKREWIYYLAKFFIYALSLASLAVILKKSSLHPERKYRFLPLLPVLIGVLYFALYPLKLYSLFSLPCRVYNVGEIFVFCAVSVIEICIQMGLIPANMGYEKLFESSHLQAMILDASGNPVYRTEAAKSPFDENTVIRKQPICGGCVEWAVDVTKLNELNRMLEDTTQKIDARNAYLQEETRIKRERAGIETRNRLYDSISQIIKPQLEKIDMLLNEENSLPEIAVLSAFIKRRSNMEMLSGGGSLTALELSSAISESLTYLHLCGVQTAVSSAGMGSYPAEMIICAYESIEAVIEESMDRLKGMTVVIRAEENALFVRMLLDVDNFYMRSGEHKISGVDFTGDVSIIKDRSDIIIAFAFAERGRE